jgi:hypothetical protein
MDLFENLHLFVPLSWSNLQFGQVLHYFARLHIESYSFLESQENFSMLCTYKIHSLLNVNTCS